MNKKFGLGGAGRVSILSAILPADDREPLPIASRKSSKQGLRAGGA